MKMFTIDLCVDGLMLMLIAALMLIEMLMVIEMLKVMEGIDVDWDVSADWDIDSKWRVGDDWNVNVDWEVMMMEKWVLMEMLMLMCLCWWVAVDGMRLRLRGLKEGLGMRRWGWDWRDVNFDVYVNVLVLMCLNVDVLMR